MSVNSNKIQLKAFELELHGYSVSEIATKLYHEFNMAYEIRSIDVQTLIDAETVLYGIASAIGDTQVLNRIPFSDEDIYEADICVWPDYEWCFNGDLDEYGANKSDDFVRATITIKDDPTLTQLKRIVDGPAS